MDKRKARQLTLLAQMAKLEANNALESLQTTQSFVNQCQENINQLNQYAHSYCLEFQNKTHYSHALNYHNQMGFTEYLYDTSDKQKRQMDEANVLKNERLAAYISAKAECSKYDRMNDKVIESIRHMDEKVEQKQQDDVTAYFYTQRNKRIDSQ